MKRLGLMVFLLAGLCYGESVTRAACEIRLAPVFQNHMVLQRERPVPVWGWANPGMMVEVRFGGQVKTVRAGEDSRWRVELDPMPASAEGRVLEVAGGPSCEDVLVGEVWLLSGQSNMEWSLGGAEGGKAVAETATWPQIRFARIPKIQNNEPQDDVAVEWKVCTPQSALRYSAIGIYFSRKLNEELGVPVGTIDTSWSGSGIEPYVTRDGVALDASGSLARDKHSTIRYNAMIHPLVPFALRGVLWYQGESNGGDRDYASKQRALVAGWRKAWNDQLPFYYVQVANHGLPRWFAEGWAICREEQLRALDMPGVGMVVAMDIGEGNLHPPNKRDVALRLARLALHHDYGRKELVYSGPLYKGYEVQGDRMLVSFDHAGSGLIVGQQPADGDFTPTPDEPLREFWIAGEDRVWHPATAAIEGARVAVSSPEVTAPVAVRYAFAQNPLRANLYNSAGLPASPFRTDDWDFMPLRADQPGAYYALKQFVEPLLSMGGDAANAQLRQEEVLALAITGEGAAKARPLLDQFYARQRLDGFIGDAISVADGSFAAGESGKLELGPPLFALAESELARTTGDTDRLSVVWPVLAKHLDWLYRAGTPGADDPSKQGRLTTNSTHRMCWAMPDGRGSVELNAQLVVAFESMAEIADMLQLRLSAKFYRDLGVALRQQLNRWCWNEEDGCYYDVRDDGSQVKTSAPDGAWALAAGLPSEDKASVLVERLMQPEALRTLSKEPAGFRRLVLSRGLERYGLKDEAERLRAGFEAAAGGLSHK